MAAAALFLVIAIGIGEGSSMPRYGLEFSGGASEMRSPTAVQAGGGASVPRLSMGSPFEIVLRPETKLDGPVESRVYVAGSGATHGELRSVALRPERSELGTLRYRGEVGRDLGLRAGEHRVVVVVAPEGELPSDEWVADALSGARAPEGFQFLTQRVAVGGEP